MGREITNPNMGVGGMKVVSGAEGTLSNAARFRSHEMRMGVDSLKPAMFDAISQLSLQDGVGHLSSRIDGIAANTYAEHRSAAELAAAVAQAAESIVAEYARINQLARNANDKYGPVHEAMRMDIQRELREYGMECLRDRYVERLSRIYAREIATGDIRIVPGVPGPDITPLMPLDTGSAEAIAHRSFAVVSRSRAILVTIDGSDEFQLIVGKPSNTTIPSQKFSGGSLVRKSKPQIGAAFEHIAELRHFANDIVAEHRELIALAETYMAYTRKLSADIDHRMASQMKGMFPKYFAWKNQRSS
jgi:hypothetical protein